MTETGYLHPGYAESLAEFGVPRPLPRSGGWILVREISGCSTRDATGCYPLFACRNWSLLHDDLNDLRKDIVGLSIVTDPLGEYDTTYLRQSFPDAVRPFKEHFIVDLSRSVQSFAHADHRP